MAFPRIVYPSGGGTTLNFLYPPRFFSGNYKTKRFDNIADSGVQERIWVRTDTFLVFTMEYVKANPGSSFGSIAAGSDVLNWDSFVNYALKGGAFDYYPDPVGAPTDIRICFLEHTDYNAKWKSLGMFTFDMVFRYRVGWPTAPPGQGGFPSSFSDSLMAADPNNPNGGSLDGSKWIFGNSELTSTNTPTDVAGYQIALSSKDSVNALLWNIGGAQNPQASCQGHLTPFLIIPATYGKIQYIQATMVQSTGIAGQGTLQAGLAVLSVPVSNIAAIFGYTFTVNTDDHSWRLYRQGSGAGLLTSGGASTTADGDIFRMWADPVTVPGQVTVTVLKNAVQLTQYVDTSGFRLLIGSPVMCCTGTTKGSGSPKSDWRNMSCGIGQ